MDKLKTIQEEHTAGDKVVGFDYQFYCFMYLALNLKHGERIGFEVKDDIHVQKPDGRTILYQAKHTVAKKADGTPDNLTTLDVDMWKTLSNWCDMIKSSANIFNTYEFRLVTNKSEGHNTFIDSFKIFRDDHDIEKVISVLKALMDKTQNKEVKLYIKNVLSVGKRRIKKFLLNLSIDTGNDAIIDRIKQRIYEHCHQRNLVDAVFESLASNLNITKYFELKDRNQFEITFEDFNDKFGKCFRVAFENKPLPKRSYTVKLPENLEGQTFIRQLLDIEDVVVGDSLIVEYTTHMLQAINHLDDWIEKNLILSTEIDELHKEAILKWQNEFHSKYRQIRKQISSGCPVVALENEIKDLGAQIVECLRKENLLLADHRLDTEISNGYYYLLSNTPEIGWHYDWEHKYGIV